MKHAIFAAQRFFTRLPVPAWVGHAPEQRNGATRYIPAVGILVGGKASECLTTLPVERVLTACEELLAGI